MSNKTKNILSGLILIVILTFSFVPILTQGQTGDSRGNDLTGEGKDKVSFSIKIENPFKEKSIEGLIRTVIEDILMPIGAVLAVLMIMYAGFLYVTASGNESKIKKAHDALLWAVIGAAILLGAWVISEAISTTIDQLRAN